jgi:pimeloyl-ACP methyl ester carboxylesterase
MPYLYDSNNIRYQLYKAREGKPLNWIFLPGGPGADSKYLSPLLDSLELPGNIWLIDLPGNGSHKVEKEDFDSWLKSFSLFLTLLTTLS